MKCVLCINISRPEAKKIWVYHFSADLILDHELFQINGDLVISMNDVFIDVSIDFESEGQSIFRVKKFYFARPLFWNL